MKLKKKRLEVQSLCQKVFPRSEKYFLLTYALHKGLKTSLVLNFDWLRAL